MVLNFILVMESKFQLKFCEIHSKISWNFTWNFKGFFGFVKFQLSIFGDYTPKISNYESSDRVEIFLKFCEISWNFIEKFHEISMKFIPISEIVKFQGPNYHLRTIALPRNHWKYINFFKETAITFFWMRYRNSRPLNVKVRPLAK